MRGIDIGIGATVLEIKDFSWYINFNISYQENEVTQLDRGIPLKSMNNIS